MKDNKIDVCTPSLIERDENYCREKLNELKALGIPVNKIIISSKKGRAAARTELMQKAGTEWFLFLDDDIELNKNWWKKISKFLEDDRVGAVNGFGLVNNIFMIFLRHLFLLRGLKHQRGFTSNTLIRKKAVEEIILKNENRFEDLELQEKIKAKGYEWRFCMAYCRHTKKASLVLAEAFSDFKNIAKEKGIIKALMSI